jgi:hypothetical protein
MMEVGEHAVTWGAGGVAAGVYFCRLQAGEMTMSRRLVVIR